MSVLSDILTRGYFPRELPPPFHTRDLQILRYKPPTDWETNKNGGLSTHAQLVHYNHRRVGTLRRRLSFTNPVLYYHLARVIDREWDSIETYLGLGNWSLVRPIRRLRSRRAFSPWIGRGGAPRIAALSRQTGRYLLRADIARFYPSVYTHSIPWALHGKSVAKANTNATASVGNELDYWLRMGQDRQTMGIPIGPDVSWVIADLMMTTVELELRDRVRIAGGLVIIDDIELTFGTRREADLARSALEGLLSEFELSLNPNKTTVQHLPTSLSPAWSDRLAMFQFRQNAAQFRADLYRYFSLAFRIARRHPEETVLKYALGRLRPLRVGMRFASPYQALLLQCLGSEPSTAGFVERELRRLRSLGAQIDADALGAVLHSLIIENAPLGYTSEVAWALWLGIVFDIPFDDEATSAVCGMMDSVVALVALHAHSEGLMTKAAFDPSNWITTQTSADLWGPHWLLSYEANRKGWLQPASGADHVLADARFAYLKNHGVSFYATRARPARTGRGIIPMVLSDEDYDPAW